MKSRMTWVVIILIVIFGGTFGWDTIRAHMVKKFMADFKPPPVTISATSAKAETWHPMLSAVGSLKAVNGVDVSSQVSGQIMKIEFKSGQVAEFNQPLVQLDDSIDQQALKNNQATLKLAELNFQRQKSLYKTNATSKSALDNANANLAKAKADVATAQVNIDKKLIKAPFAGRIGISQVNLGQYVTPGQSLVSLQAMDPLNVDFSLSEKYLKDVHVGQVIHVNVESYPDKKFEGVISAINPRVDIDTRTFLVRGVIPNKEERLHPGVFASIEVVLPKAKNVVTLPQTAVTYSLYGDSVFLVEEQHQNGKSEKTVKEVFVQTGDKKNNKVIITKGIKPGDVVVSAGQIKLRNGMSVIVDNKIDISKTDKNFNGQLY